jgi:uncharacterized cupredoxin-like copper-binding protein
VANYNNNTKSTSKPTLKPTAKYAGSSSASKKSLEERMAAQKAAETAAKRKRGFLIGGISAGAAIVITLIIIFSTIGAANPTTTVNAKGCRDITVSAGKEVVWTINAANELGCMVSVKSSLFTEKKLTPGKTTTVTFTPTTKGNVTVYCLHDVVVCTIKVT